MKRCLGWSLLLLAGLLLGVTSSSYQTTHADPPAEETADAEAPKTDALTEMKEIKTQLKEINAYLHSGVVKVVVVMNPDKDK
jgi:hypothetical protein